MAARSEAPLAGAGPVASFGRFVAHGLHLRGRASRGEYWWWMLLNVVVVFGLHLPLPDGIGLTRQTVGIGPFGVAWFADLPIHLWRLVPAAESTQWNASIAIILVVWVLMTAVPGLTVAVRRLHDTDRSGWWTLLALLGGVGQLVLLLLLTGRSRPGGARFDGAPEAVVREAMAR